MSEVYRYPNSAERTTNHIAACKDDPRVTILERPSLLLHTGTRFLALAGEDPGISERGGCTL